MHEMSGQNLDVESGQDGREKRCSSDKSRLCIFPILLVKILLLHLRPFTWGNDKNKESQKTSMSLLHFANKISCNLHYLTVPAVGLSI